ncbi:MAG: CPBP family intramembrane metalloprotease [Ruminococcus sp.]|nr:CPBP family intramembrane metalloprotease [Ruminococcus sp.]
MNKKLINKQIRKISTSTTLPVLAFLIAMTAISISLSFLISSAPYGSILRDDGFLNLIVYILLYLICIPLIVLIFQKTKGNKVGIKLSSLFRKPQKSAFWCFKWIIISIGFTYIASFVSNIIFTIIETLIGRTLNEASFDMGDSVFGLIVTIIAPVIFAPIFEELLFRGVVLKNCEPMGQWFAIIISGIIFGLWHENYPQFLFAAVLGCFSAFMVVKTRSIIPSIIVHFLINSLSTVIALIFRANDLDIDEIANMSDIELLTNEKLISVLSFSLFGFFILGIIIAAITLFVIEMVKHKGKANLVKSVFNIKTSNKIAVFMCSPVTLITFALMILSTILNAIKTV